MDVRCEKCQTEYELDESKLKPGGVTVKCTSCGHMFRVRRRGPTNLGMTARESETVALVPGEVDLGFDDPDGDRTWLVRLEDGEIKTCRELATLQRWIIAGVVSRGCAISRTGKTWKPLGEVDNLASYFAIADEARRARGTGAPIDEATQQYLLDADGKPDMAASLRTNARRSSGPAASAAAAPSSPPAEGVNKTMKIGAVPAPAPRPGITAHPRRNAKPQPSVPPDEPMGEQYPVKPVTSPPRSGVPVLTEDRPTGGWASQTPVAFDDGPSGPRGPVAGVVRKTTTHEAAFVGNGGMPEIKGEFENGSFVPSDRDSGEYGVPRSRLATWVLFGSLVVVGAAVAAIVLVMTRDGARAASPADAGATAAATAGDAAPVVVAANDAAPVVAPAASVVAGALAELESTLRADRAAALEDLLARLTPLGDGDAALALGRARLELALAQQDVDRSTLAGTPASKKRLLAAAKERAKRAHGLVDKALALTPDAPLGKLTMADARRLEGERALEVERWLKEGNSAADTLEATRVLAMLRLRDARPRDARVELDKIAAAAAGDTRVDLHLALLDVADGKRDEARQRLEAILAGGEHPVAREALATLAAAPVVDATDPMPPELPADKPSTTPTPGKPTAPSGGGYDDLLRRADKLAEGGDCADAIALYRDAIDARPAGVEALTGLGYCHLDGRDYSSAFAKFRAALGISPNYQAAMWGVAEMYQRQGLKEQAIQKYRDFLRAHPGSARAATARRQIERLGGTLEEGGPASEQPIDPETSPIPTPTEPAPTPTEPAPSDPSVAPDP